MFCSKCGTENDVAGAQFCAHCGSILAAPQAYATPAQPYAQPAQPYFQVPQPAPAEVKPVLANLALIFSVVSLVLLPFVFGGAAFILAIIALVQKQKNAVLAMVLSCILPVIGFAIAYSIALNSYSGY